MRNRLIFAVAVTVLTISCKNTGQEADKGFSDSTAKVQTIRTEDSIALATNNITSWLKNELKLKDVTWQQLHLQEYYTNDSLQPEPIDPDPNFYKDYQSVLRWSPDSSYILDFGSYGSVLVKDADGKTRVEAGEPDSEVSLLQPAQNQKLSLFFVGPSSNIFNAKWVNKSNVLILGSFDETGNGQPDTLFWLVDVKDNFYRMYKWRRK